MMKRITTIIALAMILSVGFWTLNPSQSFARKSSEKAGIAASSHVSGVVIGKQIRNERDAVLGTVENIVLNDSGCAQYVILSGKFRGARARLYPIPWTVIARTGPDAIFVDLDPAFFAEAPSFEFNRWPDFSQAQFQTQIRTFYEKRAQGAGPGEFGKTPGAVRSDEKGKTEKDLRAKQKHWGTPATEGTAPAEEKSKEKARIETERKHKPSEMGPQGAVESPKQRETDIKAKQHKPETSGMMERGKTEMNERGKMQMMERGRPEQGKFEKQSAPGSVGAPSGSSQTEERMK